MRFKDKLNMIDQNNIKKFEVTSDELYDLLQKKESLLLFDLRLQETYNAGHINGAVHAVCDVRTKDTIMPKIPKNIKLILIDDDGIMSEETTKMMRSFGFFKVG